jgi:hypothetical protein
LWSSESQGRCYFGRGSASGSGAPNKTGAAAQKILFFAKKIDILEEKKFIFILFQRASGDRSSAWREHGVFPKNGNQVFDGNRFSKT